jgi:hypothetical protein
VPMDVCRGASSQTRGGVRTSATDHDLRCERVNVGGRVILAVSKGLLPSAGGIRPWREPWGTPSGSIVNGLAWPPVRLCLT